MSEIFFSSDHHFYHSNIRLPNYADRPHNSVDEMNEDLIKKWNDAVSPNDTICYLGDFSLAFRAVEVVTPRLNGKKILIPGNHDFCHSYHQRSRKSEDHRKKWIEKYAGCGWTVLPERIMNWYDPDLGCHINLCHHPYKGDEFYENGKRDKYWNYRLDNDPNTWLICGHVHQKWRVKDNMINVGVDVWDYTPVNISKIKEIIDSNTHQK